MNNVYNQRKRIIDPIRIDGTANPIDRFGSKTHMIEYKSQTDCDSTNQIGRDDPNLKTLIQTSITHSSWYKMTLCYNFED